MTPWRVRLLTRAARRLARPLRLAGVDPYEFVLLLEARLLLEHRRADAAAGTLASLRNAAQTLLVILAAHVSVAMGMGAFLVADPFVWMAASQALVAALVAMPVVMDHLPMLLEVDDLAVVEPLPLLERSFLAVRAAHIALSVGMLVVAASLPASLIAAVAYRSPFVVPVTLLGSAGTALLVVSGFTALLVVAVRCSDPARARSAVVVTQIGAAVLAFGGLQLGAPLAERLGWPAAIAADPRLWALVPPAHAGGLLRLALGRGQPGDGLLALLAIALPLAALAVVRGLTGPGLFLGLNAAASRAGSRRPESRLARRIAAAVTRPGAERAGYDFVRAVAATERRYAMAVWGSLAAVVFMVANMSLTFGRGLDLAPLAIYGVVLIVFGAADMARSSENWRARTVFLDVDADDRSAFVRGAARRIVLCWLVVPCVVWVPVCVAIDPWRAGVGAVGAAAAAVTLGTTVVRRSLDRVPFTEAADAGRPIGVLLRLLGLASLAMVAAAVHAGLTFLPLGPVVAVVVWTVPAVLATRRFRAWSPTIPPVAAPADVAIAGEPA